MSREIRTKRVNCDFSPIIEMIESGIEFMLERSDTRAATELNCALSELRCSRNEKVQKTACYTSGYAFEQELRAAAEFLELNSLGHVANRLLLVLDQVSNCE